ncbi:SNARE domain protein [Dictyocaulus viviparus]|uniref:SNARE domain protein n=1 Tax=Dictyocaulus viviparus TaxID=29172 RepID=A0A0D8XY57_DICVI|nr:SNARE domain protein [Dictyocaulus viviparus]
METRHRRHPILGVTRSLTEVFTLLRTNSQQNKFIYMNSSSQNRNRNKNVAEENMSLVSLEEGSEECIKQPLWIHTCDEVDFELGRIRNRLEDLANIQGKHISRPNFGDEALEAEERQMETMTEQITLMLSHCQRLINTITTQNSRSETNSERKLRENTVSALFFTLSQLTNDFRTRQSKYLNDIKNRTSNVNSFLLTTGQPYDLQWDEVVGGTPSREYTMDQIQQMLVNERTVKEREKEVLIVNSSIRELNSLFKDLSSMVVDQGTILDRIDYDIEQTFLRISHAFDSVKIAEKHQRNEKKMHCIFCQTITIIVIVLLIIFTRL